MSARVAYVWSDDFLSYKFSPGHPLNPIRLQLTRDLLEDCNLLQEEDVVPAQPADEDLLLQVHDAQYVAQVRRMSATGRPAPDAAAYGLDIPDNPVFAGMHEAALRVVGASAQAAELVISGRAEHAVNIGGGLHHALPRRANGFCIYNDPAVAISHLRRRHGARVLYVDVDAHHGDGVQWIFYEDPHVLTVSIHESGEYLFPGTGHLDEIGAGAGKGYSVNIPLRPHTDDASWLECLEMVLVPLCRAFRPDVIVSQHGCDGHLWDPLTHLALTTAAFEGGARLLHELAHECAGARWVVTGGGGYDLYRVVPRAWTLVWSTLAGRPCPDEVPAPWLARWQPRAPAGLPRHMRDDPAQLSSPFRRDGFAPQNRAAARRALEQALAYVRA